MGTTIYNLSIERMTQQDLELTINEFISCGWELHKTWSLADVHTFLTFIWDKNSEPIYPLKYQSNK